MKVDLHTMCEEIFTVVELHKIQKKSTVNDNKSKIKDNTIWISYLMYMYFKINLQIKSRVLKRTSDYFFTNTATVCVYKIKQ